MVTRILIKNSNFQMLPNIRKVMTHNIALPHAIFAIQQIKVVTLHITTEVPIIIINSHKV